MTRRLVIVVDVDETALHALGGLAAPGLLSWEAGRTEAIRALIAASPLGAYLTVIETKDVPLPVIPTVVWK